jgi:hypothetical protein
MQIQSYTDRFESLTILIEGLYHKSIYVRILDYNQLVLLNQLTTFVKNTKGWGAILNKPPTPLGFFTSRCPSHEKARLLAQPGFSGI